MKDDPLVTSEIGRAMLRAGATEQPERAAVDRTLASIAAFGAATGTSATTAAASTAGLSALGKWGAVVGVCGLLVVAGLVVEQMRSAPALRPALSFIKIGDAPTPAVAETATTEPVPAAAPSTSSRSSVHVSAPPSVSKPGAPSLAEELAAVETARALLARGDAKGCLTQLALYDKTFPRGVLAQEAVVLRIDALVRSGDRAGARVLADRALAGNRSSPYAARIRSLVGDAPNP